MLWRTPWKVSGSLFYAAVVGGVVVLATIAHGPTFRFLTREDSVLEWPQFFGFAGAAVFAALSARQFARHELPLLGVLFALMALACVFIAGEEISWGQRVFGFETSESWAEKNRQGETTIHNLHGILLYFNIAMFVVSAYAVAVMLLYLGRPRPDNFFGWLIPPAYLITAFATMAFYKGVRLTVVRGSRFTIVKVGEWAELCLAAALFVFAVETYRRLGREFAEPIHTDDGV